MSSIDIYNANLVLLGSKDRLDAHRDGDWHKTFHCWIVNSDENNSSILLQRRSLNKKNYPGLFDVSAAGHLESGESDKDGIREVNEELGINPDFSDFYNLGYRVEVADEENGQRNREYQSVYMLQYNKLLEFYSPQVEEVAGLFWLNIKAGISMFTGEQETASVYGMMYSQEKSIWQKESLTITVKDFIPRIQNYYLTACVMAERLVEKRFPLCIS